MPLGKAGCIPARRVTPLFRSDPIGGSEPDPGCSDTVTPQLGIGCQVRGHSFFFSSSINLKLVHSYIVKHLTCIIFCSSGLQNIYTSSIYGSVQHLQYLHCLQNFIYKIDLKVF